MEITIPMFHALAALCYFAIAYVLCGVTGFLFNHQRSKNQGLAMAWLESGKPLNSYRRWFCKIHPTENRPL